MTVRPRYTSVLGRLGRQLGGVLAWAFCRQPVALQHAHLATRSAGHGYGVEQIGLAMAVCQPGCLLPRLSTPARA